MMASTQNPIRFDLFQYKKQVESKQLLKNLWYYLRVLVDVKHIQLALRPASLKICSIMLFLYIAFNFVRFFRFIYKMISKKCENLIAIYIPTSIFD